MKNRSTKIFNYPDPDKSPDEVRYERVRGWQSGVHTTSKGTVVELKSLPTPHLQNAINKYKDTHDVSALQEELDFRDEK